jgi:hypothetical protein
MKRRRRPMARTPAVASSDWFCRQCLLPPDPLPRAVLLIWEVATARGGSDSSCQTEMGLGLYVIRSPNPRRDELTTCVFKIPGINVDMGEIF